MNDKGNIGLIVIIVIALIAIIPGIVVTLFPPVKILFQIFAVFMLYNLVRGMIGPGLPAILISAVLIWFLAFKYPGIFAAVWTFQTLLGLQFMSMVIWSTASLFRPK